METIDCFSKFFTNEDNLQLSSSSGIQSPYGLEASQDLSQFSVESDELGLSHMTIEEPEQIDVQSFFNITPRLLPQSPHYIIEESFSSNPWAMLIATIFLTKTSAKNARPFMKSFFEVYPSPYDVLNDSPVSLERFFDKLGLRKRGYMIWKLSYQFVSAKWRRASDLCGIGKYGEDAYRIFCLGHTDVDPNDRYLKLYLDWLRCNTDYIQESGVADSEYFLEDPILKYYSITLRAEE